MKTIIRTLTVLAILTTLSIAKDEKPPLFKSEPLITAQYTSATLKQLFTTIAMQGKINLIYDDGIQLTRVVPSFNIKDLPFNKAMEIALTTNAVEVFKVTEDTFVLYPSNKAQQYEKNIVKTYDLVYLEAAKLIPVIQPILAVSQQQGIKLITEEKGNTMIALAPLETQEQIAGLIKDLDKNVPQVMVELKIVEASHEKNKDLGSPLNKYEISSTQFLPLDRAAGLTTDSFPALIKFLQTTSNVKMLANPNIRVMDRQKAQIQITDQVPVQISTTQINSSPTTGGTPSAFTTTQVQFFDIGIKFIITPTIHSSNEVSIDLNAEITSLGKISAINNIPEIGKRSAQTIIRLKDGETTIMSGLKKEEERITKTHIPIISDLPIIGGIFDLFLGGTQTQTIESEIVMSITPHIIKANDQK